jgi:sigma-B regulation protein RsbQ
VLQSRDDAIAPIEVGQYVADHVADGTLVVLDAVGHCPHVSAPAEVVSAMREFLDRSPVRGT